MSRVCSICGKGQMSGNKVSHSNIKTRRSWGVNVQKVQVVDEKGAVSQQYVCTRCLRTLFHSFELEVPRKARHFVVFTPNREGIDKKVRAYRSSRRDFLAYYKRVA